MFPRALAVPPLSGSRLSPIKGKTPARAFGPDPSHLKQREPGQTGQEAISRLSGGLEPDPAAIFPVFAPRSPAKARSSASEGREDPLVPAPMFRGAFGTRPSTSAYVQEKPLELLPQQGAQTQQSHLELPCVRGHPSRQRE